jgi:hypothetical protein
MEEATPGTESLGHLRSRRIALRSCITRSIGLITFKISRLAPEDLYISLTKLSFALHRVEIAYIVCMYISV